MDIQIIETWARDYCTDNGLFLVKIEKSGTKITVYADSLENITIRQCGQLSRHLQNKIDEDESDILNIYSFDVSSPGMSNSLILPVQFQKRLWKNMEITTIDGEEKVGKLVEVDDEKITIEVTIPKNKKTKEEERVETYTYKYDQIKKAMIPLPANFNKK